MAYHDLNDNAPGSLGAQIEILQLKLRQYEVTSGKSSS